MTQDPERLLRNPSSPLSLLLMRAGADEKPPAAALRRTAKAVAAAAVGAATTASAAASTSASSVAHATGANATGLAGAAMGAGNASGLTKGAVVGIGVVAKWFGLGVLGGALAAPLSLRMMPTPDARPPGSLGAKPAAPPDTRVVRDARHARAVHDVQQLPDAPSTTSAVVTPATPRAREVPSPLEAPARLSPAPTPSDRAKQEAPARPDAAVLAAEVAFVDEGRAALQRGDFARSFELLAPYEDRFPQQQLLTEVLYLRMETQSRLGATDRARSLAARVISRGVAGPQAARAREVLER